VVTIDDVRAITSTFPRSYEAEVRGGVRFRVGRLVYAAFGRDPTLMGVAFPKEMRDGIVRGEPEKFVMPGTSELRYNWIVVRLEAIDVVELRELLEDAWQMVVPKSVAEAHLGDEA
jgi:hypothetical protein